MPRELPRTNHFGFQLAAPDDVRAARERLRKADVPEAEWQDTVFLGKSLAEVSARTKGSRTCRTASGRNRS